MSKELFDKQFVHFMWGSDEWVEPLMEEVWECV